MYSEIEKIENELWDKNNENLQLSKQLKSALRDLYESQQKVCQLSEARDPNPVK